MLPDLGSIFFARTASSPSTLYRRKKCTFVHYYGHTTEIT